MPDALWGGRFSEPLDPAVAAFTRSFGFDARLAGADLIGSMAHARMLMETGVLERGVASRILQGLSGMLTDLEAGSLEPVGAWEDVHTWLEGTLRERIGEEAGHLHTARSRNDQTGLALRIWLRVELERTGSALAALLRTWLEHAGAHTDTLLPGYTHMQRAQPVSLAHHILAHVHALAADAGRLRRCHDAAGVSPLGAGALAGTSHHVDPERAAWLAGLDAAFSNSLLAVADRDYVAEALFFAALLQSHLARWAEEIILWTTPEFGFARLTDRVAKGSSLMPQKKNPEAAEIVRGRAGRTVGNLTALLTTLKGLPLAYNSDLQEDKEPLFDSLGTVRGSLETTRVMSAGITYDIEAMGAALERGHVTATDLADYLVRRGVPFREAHEAVGRLVQAADARGIQLWSMDLEEIREECPDAESDVFDAIQPASSAASRTSPGGPAPGRVAAQLAAVEESVAGLEAWLAARGQAPVRLAHEAGTLWKPDSPELDAHHT